MRADYEDGMPADAVNGSPSTMYWGREHASRPEGSTVSNEVYSVDGSVSQSGQLRKAGGLPGLPGYHDWSEDALALRLVSEWMEGNWCYVEAWGRWMRWTGSRWELDDRSCHRALVRKFLRACANEVGEPGLARMLKSNATCRNVENMARSDPKIAAGPEQWDAAPLLLGTPEGTVDLSTGELREPRQEDWITYTTSVTPAEGDCPQWQSFLSRIFPGKPEVIEFLQRYAGYALTGHTREHKLLFAYGTGRNGKSVFLNTLAYVFGQYHRVAQSKTLLASGSEDHPTVLASLAGARLVLTNELPQGQAWNEPLLKQITGGDPITCRWMRKNEFTYTPQFSLIIAGNHLPSLSAVDAAIRARLLVVPFSEVIADAECDPQLEEKLKEEGPQILQWCIKGALEWQNKGLASPSVVQKASREYLDGEDDLAEFVNECLVADPDGFIPNGQLCAEYRSWCQERGIKSDWSKKSLTQGLQKREFEVGRRQNQRGLKGYRFAVFPDTDYSRRQAVA